jgi:hypothetical protein
MSYRYKIIISYAILSLAVFALFANISLARENYFSPAQGDVNKSVAGDEYIIVSEDGGFSVLDQDRTMLAGYPKFIDNSVIASSPILADITGDSAEEIVFIVRNASNEYLLYIYNGDGTVLASKNLGTKEIYYDPAKLKGAVNSVFVANTNGEVFKYTYENSVIVETLLLNLGKPVAVSAVSYGTEIIASYPNELYFEVYNLSGAVWSKSKTIAVSSPVIYPFKYNDDNSVIYGSDKANALVAFSRMDWKFVSGFPVSLQKTIIGPPVVFDADATQEGKEILVPVSDGTLEQVKAGGALAGSYGTERFADNQNAFGSSDSKVLMRSVGSYITELVQQTSIIIESAISRIKAIIITTPLSTTITASQETGVPPFSTSFTANPSGGAATNVPTKLNFNNYTLEDYLWTGMTGTATTQDNGDTLLLDKFIWKSMPFPYIITPNTVIELDFKADDIGWEHAISMYMPWSTSGKLIALAGAAKYDYSINDYNAYLKKGEWQHYKIPIGQHYTGNATNLIFTTYCNNAWCPAVFNSYFKNVHVYESDRPYYTYTWDFGDGTTIPSSVINSLMEHTYTADGNFTAKVVVSDGKTSVEKSVGITVNPAQQPAQQLCLEVITWAKETEESQCQEFGNSCIPDGWIKCENP